MPNEFQYDVFLSHSRKDKEVVRPLAERLRQDGLKVWPVPPKPLGVGGFADRVLKPGVSIPAKIDPPSLRGYGGTGEGLEHCQFGFRISEFGFAQPGMSANAFGSDWAQLEAGTCERRNLRFRDSLNRERRFIPLRLDDAPIKGSLAQFLYIYWRPVDHEQEYAKLLEAHCQAGKAGLACQPGFLLRIGNEMAHAPTT